MIVVWHTNNLKVSHFNSSEITKSEGYMSRIYGGLTVNRVGGVRVFGNVCQLNKSRNGKGVHGKIPGQCTKGFTENMGKAGATLSTDHIFKVHNERKTQYLQEEQDHILYNTAMQLFFMSTRSRQDI